MMEPHALDSCLCLNRTKELNVPKSRPGILCYDDHKLMNTLDQVEKLSGIFILSRISSVKLMLIPLPFKRGSALMAIITA
ncbi:MAG: hypothetical protein RL693_440 [Verrucomicrobiota bacterium]|jgi:hypothetical protein